MSLSRERTLHWLQDACLEEMYRVIEALYRVHGLRTRI